MACFSDDSPTPCASKWLQQRGNVVVRYEAVRVFLRRWWGWRRAMEREIRPRSWPAFALQALRHLALSDFDHTDFEFIRLML